MAHLGGACSCAEAYLHLSLSWPSAHHGPNRRRSSWTRRCGPGREPGPRIPVRPFLGHPETTPKGDRSVPPHPSVADPPAVTAFRLPLWADVVENPRLCAASSPHAGIFLASASSCPSFRPVIIAAPAAKATGSDRRGQGVLAPFIGPSGGKRFLSRRCRETPYRPLKGVHFQSRPSSLLLGAAPTPCLMIMMRPTEWRSQQMISHARAVR